MDNYLPSVSAAIGDYVPQRDVWRVAVFLHTIPRIYIASIYYTYYVGILEKRVNNAIIANWALNVTEILSLLGLTVISSTYNYSEYILL